MILNAGFIAIAALLLSTYVRAAFVFSGKDAQ